MQPLKQLAHALRLLADRGHCVFSGSDLVAAVRDTIDKQPYWRYLTEVVTDHGRRAIAALQSPA